MVEQTLQRVLIMAGGTGGHVYPALAIAKTMREQNIQVTWLGTRVGIEADVVPRHFEIDYIHVSALRGKGIYRALSMPFILCRALYECICVIRKRRPQVVLGMGGFVAGPGGIAAWLYRIPLVIHEQNAVLGFTNRWLALVATRLLEAFPQAFKRRPQAVTCGNPVRAEFNHFSLPTSSFTLKNRPLRLFVLGGSLGAAAFNEIVPKALALLPPELRPEVIHQTGKKHEVTTRLQYAATEMTANIQPFIEDMVSAYAWADIVLCRAGASSIAELCAVGRGAILVPYPEAADDHQTANARYLVQQGAACLMPQIDFNPRALADTLRHFQEDPSIMHRMAQSAYHLRKMNVTEHITALCQEVCL